MDVHTITLKYGTTKGGKHAYDYLTGWNFSEYWITLADRCQGITKCEDAVEDNFPMTSADTNIPWNYFNPGTAQGQDFFTMRGGDITAATKPQKVSGSYAGDSETVVTVTFRHLRMAPCVLAAESTRSARWSCGSEPHVAAFADWNKPGAGWYRVRRTTWRLMQRTTKPFAA